MRLYLTQEQALRDYNLTQQELETIIAAETVGTVLLRDKTGERLVVKDDDLAAYVAGRDITPEKFEHLRGNLLNMSEAGMKYGVIPTVISGWVKQGRLDVKDTGSRNQKFVDEADVAYLVELGRAKNMRPGKKVFD